MANPFDQFDVTTKAGNPFDQFDAPVKRDRTIGESLTDVYAGLKTGLGRTLQLPGQLAGVVTGEYEKPGEETGLAAYGKEVEKAGEALQSPGLLARKEARAEKIAAAEKRGQLDAFMTAFSETLRDPGLLTNFLAEQAPQLIPSLGAARLIKPIAGTAAAVRGAIGTGAVQQGADIAAGTYEQVYNELIKQGSTEEEAAGRAIGLARATGAGAAAISLLAQRLPGAKAIEEAFAGQEGKLGRVLGAGRAGLGEAIGETAEETPAKFFQNLAMAQVAPETSLTAGLGETAAMAALGGAGMGAGVGLAQRQAGAGEMPPQQQRPSQFAPEPEGPVEPTAPAGIAAVPPALPAPVEAAAPPVEPGMPPVEPTVEPGMPPIPAMPEPPQDAVAAMQNYWMGSPADFGMSFADIQNRDRTKPASIQQMMSIARQPDYNRLSVSRDFGAGAPVVISDIEIDPTRLGRIDTVSASDGTKIPVQYAVMDAREITPSNRADGTTVDQYADPAFEGIRPVAGNGRIAGLQELYRSGPYSSYVQQMMGDAAHGISSEVISTIEQPVLVRIMPKSALTPDIADKSNVGGQLGMSPTEQAKIDMGRFDLQGIQFLADGSPSLGSLRQFVAAMPKEEQAELMNRQGQPTPLAKIRLANALFARAYANDALIDLYAETTDPEAQQILRGMAIASPAMSNLSEAGEYDIRPYVTKAAELAVNARRQGVDLAAYLDQGDIELDPLTREVVSMFAANKNAPRRIGDSLVMLAAEANRAAEQASAPPDMFGDVAVKRPLEDVFAILRGEPTQVAPIVEEEEAPEKLTYQIGKSEEQIAQEIDGMNVVQVADWLVDNAPNSFAKIVSEAVRSRVKAMQARKIPMTFKLLRGAERPEKVYGAVNGRYTGNVRFDVTINAPTAPGERAAVVGTEYRTLLHEMLHLATQGQIHIEIGKGRYPTSGPIYELENLRKFIMKKVREDRAAGRPVPRRLNREQALLDVHELISYGFTEVEVQQYLASIAYKNKNGFTRFVDAIRKLMAINKTDQTAMERLVSLTDEILEVPAKDIAAKLKAAGVRFGVGAIGTPSMADTRTPEFRKWFGDSKVVDEDGEPLTVYHGTTSDITEFRKRALGTNTLAKSAFGGFFFTNSPENAAEYSIGTAVRRTGLSAKDIIAAWSDADRKEYAEIKNYRDSLKPKGARTDSWMMTDEWRNRNRMVSETFDRLLQKNDAGANVMPVYLSIKNPLEYDMKGSTYRDKSYADIIAEAREQGRDGVIIRNTYDPLFGDVYVAFEPNQIKSVFNQRPTESKVITEAREPFADIPEDRLETPSRAQAMLEEKWKQMKAGAPKEKPSSFSDVDEDLWKDISKQFFPQNKNIVQKIDGMQDRFWQRLAQGIADQYRTIKDYDPVAYMKARMSSTVDGALEGILFEGEVKLTDGALDIAKGTKGLLKAMEPVGNEVDRYQIWVALQRDAAIVEKSNRAREKIAELEQYIKDLSASKSRATKKFDTEIKLIIEDESLSDKQKREALSSLRKSLDRFKNDVDRDMRLQRAEIAGLKASIKMSSIPQNIVEQRNKLSAGKLGDKSRLEVYEAVQKDMNKLNRSVLNIALQQGIIDRQAFETLARDINYIPFYKVMEEGDSVQAAATNSGLVNQYFSKALKGGEKPFGDLMENTLRNWSHILSASMKNEAANATIKAAINIGAAFPNMKAAYEWQLNDEKTEGKVYKSGTDELVGDGSLKPEYTSSDGKGLVKTMIDGKPAYFKVDDPLLIDAIMAIGYMGPKSKFLDVARDFKNILQFGVTVSPAFKVRNLIRDSVQSAAVSGIGLNIAKNVTQGIAASKKGNPDYISALAGGAIFNFGSYVEGDQAKMIKRLIEQGVKGENILDTEAKLKAGLKRMWDGYQDWGNRSEAANRMALYIQLREKGFSHLEASFQARDLLDFSMQGAWPAVRMLTQVIPFLNARVQGLYKLGRDGITPTSRVIYNSITGKPIDVTDKQKAQQFSIVTGAVVLASLMLYMSFKDDDEWKKREQWDRDNFWWFKMPGMDAAIRIPKPFEIGAFGTFAERIAEQMMDEGAEGKVFAKSLSRMLTDTFAINPIPQAFKPLVDLYANKDSFTGAPIETAGMERLSKAERVAVGTSPLAKALSNVVNVFLPESTELSPVQADYAIKAYLGWMGATISATSHYAVMPFSKAAYPDHNWAETMSLGFVKTLPTAQSGYVTSFYENMKTISQAYADMRHYAQLGESDKMREVFEEKGDKIMLAKMYDQASKDMAKMRQVIQVIQRDENMSGAQKKEEIDRLKMLIGDLAKMAEETRVSITKQYKASR